MKPCSHVHQSLNRARASRLLGSDECSSDGPPGAYAKQCNRPILAWTGSRKKGENHMRYRIALLCQHFVCGFKRSVLFAGLVFCVASSAVADDVTVSEQTFDCILDWPAVRN